MNSYRKKRNEWLLKNGPCATCGSLLNLEVDHIDPRDKSFRINFSLSLGRIKKELDKCQVLCKACHREKTNKELSRPITHGTTSGYQYYKCRCSLCRKAIAVYVMKDRSNYQYKSNQGITHGTVSGYQHFKCRCSLCKEAKSDYKRGRETLGRVGVL